MAVTDFVKDPATGKIKPVVIVAAGGIGLAAVFLVMGRGSNNTGTSAGQSSDITGSLGDLQAALEALIANPPKPGAGGSSGSGSGSGGSGPATLYKLGTGQVSLLQSQGAPLSTHQLHLLHIGQGITLSATQLHILHEAHLGIVNVNTGGLTNNTKAMTGTTTYRLNGTQVNTLSIAKSPLSAHQLHVLHTGGKVSLSPHQLHVLHTANTPRNTTPVKR